MDSGKEVRSMKRRITAMLIVLVMLLGMMPGKSWAEEREYTYQIGPFINGLVDGKIMVGHTISFDVDDVISSNLNMMGIYLSEGNPKIYTWDVTYEERGHTFESGAGKVSWEIPVDAVAGQKIQIVFKFGGEDYDVFYSEVFTLCEDISGAWVSALSDKTYNGAPLTQSLTVMMHGGDLKEGKDYTVSYKNNTNAGTATVTVNGKGGFIGSITKSFQINKAPNSMTAQGKTVKIKASKLKKKKQVIKPTKSLRICNAVGNLKFRLAGINKKKFKKYFKVNARNGNITVKKGLKKGNTN